MPNNNPQQQTTPQQQISRAAEGATKAAERLGETAEHASSVAIERVRQVRDEAQSGIEQQRDQVAERIRRLSGVLRAGSQTLSTDDPLAQQLFETAGERIEQVADYINNITPGDLADDITSLARRRPGLFFGGSFILGLALGRFVKSSAGAVSSGYEQDDDENTQAVRPSGRGAARKQRRAQGAQAADSNTQRTSTSGGTAKAQAQSSAASNKPAASTSSPSTGSSAGSSSTGTVGSGSSHGPSSSPSYGASSSATTASKPQSSSSQTESSSTPREVERGEGSKS